MSAFSSHWLNLREGADHRARADFSSSLVDAGLNIRTVIDLGCGSGSNLRYLQSRLPAVQRWICVDRDHALLQLIDAQNNTTISTVNADIAHDISALLHQLRSNSGIQAGSDADCLVCASALLDLCSAQWIETLAGACASISAAAWFALSVDGRIALDPTHHEDEHLVALFNAHQHSDKGIGEAAGPDAHGIACTAFQSNGFTVVQRQSDWQLSAADADLQRALISGWLAAAREQCSNESALRDWEDQRMQQLNAGRLETTVGHYDLLALPPRRLKSYSTSSPI